MNYHALNFFQKKTQNWTKAITRWFPGLAAAHHQGLESQG